MTAGGAARGALRHLDVDLQALDDAGLLRAARPLVDPEAIVFGSNDYLGLGAAPVPASTEPGGAGASRLVSGDHPAHRAAEAALAEWVGCEASLLFTSGYAANVGTIAALAGRGDLVLSDALNHASIIDGCRLSGAEVAVVPHRDRGAFARALETRRSSARRAWVITESYFSMDGDVAPLAALRELCDRHDAALVVDEAHALGVFGPAGAGLGREAGVPVDVLIGTLGKAVGLQGAFVAGSEQLRTWLWNRARSFVFSTGLSPAIAAVVASRVDEVRNADAARGLLVQRSGHLRAALRSGGLEVAGERGPIIPVIIGDADRAVALARHLEVRGLLVRAIRPPTVPAGSSRLRITVSAGTSTEAFERALAAVTLELSAARM